MLFKWKHIGEPNVIVHNVELKLGFKVAGRGLHGLRRSFSDRLFENNLTIPDIKTL